MQNSSLLTLNINRKWKINHYYVRIFLTTISFLFKFVRNLNGKYIEIKRGVASLIRKNSLIGTS
jgi:hypothetical protein